MQFLRAARGLLHKVAVLDSHSDLVAQGEKQPKFSGAKTAGLLSAEEQHPERLRFGLQANPHDGAQVLAHRELAETAERVFDFKGFPGRIATEIAEHHKPAQA